MLEEFQWTNFQLLVPKCIMTMMMSLLGCLVFLKYLSQKQFHQHQTDEWLSHKLDSQSCAIETKFTFQMKYILFVMITESHFIFGALSRFFSWWTSSLSLFLADWTRFKTEILFMRAQIFNFISMCISGQMFAFNSSYCMLCLFHGNTMTRQFCLCDENTISLLSFIGSNHSMSDII